ncbi:MAG: hypothetical protein AAFW81_00965 [Pseudomonadota bacterium]
MNKLILAAPLSLVASPAFAGIFVVPEMSAGAGVAAIALLAGAVAIIRERNKRK